MLHAICHDRISPRKLGHVDVRLATGCRNRIRTERDDFGERHVAMLEIAHGAKEKVPYANSTPVDNMWTSSYQI
jgi:hypothetical protein